ncbi:MAG: SDR family NAD(P)-dependent oxidoreductase [Rhodospirillaceae bacterium]
MNPGPRSNFRPAPAHVLVTGGAGFIGSHTVDLLLAHGCRVTVLDNLSTGYAANLAQCEGRPDYDFVEADITQDFAPALERAARRFGPIERIAHFAAQTAVPLSVDDPITDISVNVAGTVRVLEYARRHKVRKIAFASSSAIYDDDATVPVSEASTARPASPYGIDKLAVEFYLDYYARYHGLAFTALRFMNVYGPRQDPSSYYSGVISIFMDRAFANQPITIFDDGEQTRDFVYVSDVADAVVTAALTDAGNGAIINIGTGIEVSVNEITRTILELTGSRSPVRHEAPRPGDIRRSVTTMNRAKELLGFDPKVDLREGLSRTLAWVRQQALVAARRGSAA